MVRRGWNIVFQSGESALLETNMGEYPKFLSQCLRWVRTTWRSNSASLFTCRTVWRRQPWCVYAVYLTSFVNFALFYDAAMVISLWKTVRGSGHASTAMLALIGWILASKLVKPFPHFWRNPKDLVYFPAYVLFGYYHSLIKLYALLTFWETAWGSRKNVA
jgi:hypothetical protein